jgi:hypothetical protein
MDRVLGLDLQRLAERRISLWKGDSEVVKLVVREREEARKRKDFARADEIRETLDRMGISIKDTPEGTRWKRLYEENGSQTITRGHSRFPRIPRNNSESELFTVMLGEKSVTFETVYRATYSLLIKIAYHITNDMEASEDLCQEAYIDTLNRKEPILPLMRQNMVDPSREKPLLQSYQEEGTRVQSVWEIRKGSQNR